MLSLTLKALSSALDFWKQLYHHVLQRFRLHLAFNRQSFKLLHNHLIGYVKSKHYLIHSNCILQLYSSVADILILLKFGLLCGQLFINVSRAFGCILLFRVPSCNQNQVMCTYFSFLKHNIHFAMMLKVNVYEKPLIRNIQLTTLCGEDYVDH